METDDPKLSQSEARLLRTIAGGEEHQVALDWLVLQHLKQKGLLEVTLSGPKITEKGRRAISDF
jgi:hypothetical protein